MIKYTTLVCPGAGAGVETSVYRLRLQPKFSAPVPQPWFYVYNYIRIAEICRIGEGKKIHQVEYLQDEQLIIALTGRQRQMRLIPIREA
jgi:hypothetical protein